MSSTNSFWYIESEAISFHNKRKVLKIIVGKTRRNSNIKDECKIQGSEIGLTREDERLVYIEIGNQKRYSETSFDICMRVFCHVDISYNLSVNNKTANIANYSELFPTSRTINSVLILPSIIFLQLLK